MNGSKSGTATKPCRTPFCKRAVKVPVSYLTDFPSGMSENEQVWEWINNIYLIKIHPRSPLLLCLKLPHMHNEIRLFIWAFHPLPARWPVCQGGSFQPRWCGCEINISWIQKVFVSSSLRRESLNTKKPVYSSAFSLLYTLCSAQAVIAWFAKCPRVLISPW